MTPHPPTEPPPVAGRDWPRLEDLRRRRRTMRTVRWVMVGVGVVAGAVLIVAGATLVGVVIAGLAVMRGVVMLTIGRQMQRRAPGRHGARLGWRTDPTSPSPSPPPT